MRLTVGGVTAARVYGTEIAHAAEQGPAPAALPEHIAKTLRAVATGGETRRAMITAAPARIDRRILGYRCWMDGPGNDVQ